MGFLDDCKKYLGADDLYCLFSVPKTVKDSDLKKAYYKLSLKVHPDKAEEANKETANRQFQIVTKAYYVLSDKEKRAIYDEQGVVDEEDVSQEKDWKSYWRELFPRITLKDIDDYMKKYKGSEEEQEDLKTYYEKFEGDVLKIYTCIPGHAISEEPRYKEILEEMISDGLIQEYPAFKVKESKKNTAKRLKKAQKEAEEAEETLKEMGFDKNSDLAIAIAQRQRHRESAFDSLVSDLEAKYSKPKATKKGKKK